jgi:hypothetical protein
MIGRARLALALVILASGGEARADEPAGVAYGFAGAEVATVGTVAIHLLTDASPGSGAGLALNFLPIVVGVGSGILGETQDLDARPPLAFHGAVVGGLSLFAIGASIDGRNAKTGVTLGATSLTLGALGAVGGAYFAATRVDTTNEAIAVGVAPFVGAFGGAIAFAIVHFFDDIGPRSTGRLLRFTGAGMFLGTVGSFAYAYKDRGEPASTTRVGWSASPRMLSFGGAF